MDINNINIIFYILMGIGGIILGMLIDWANVRLPEYKKVFSKEFFTVYLRNFKPNYIILFTTAALSILILFLIGWQSSTPAKLKLIKFLMLTPLLISAFCIDKKLQIIPNRLNLCIFEVGLAFAFMHGMCNVYDGIEFLLGGLLGAGIFLLITLIGGLIAGKEAMGFGDVKLMGALGLFFGWKMIIAVSLIAFLIAAISSIVLIVTKKKKTNEYIPFGPFIVIASFIVMILPANLLVFVLFKIFTLGMYKGTL